MALTSLKSTENALNLVEMKKEKLKKAFEELQFRSSMLSSFDLTWADLDSYFTSRYSELLQKFSTLQAVELSQTCKHNLTSQKFPFSHAPVPARPELKSICEKMDAVELCRYIMGRPKERPAIRLELADAFKHAPDPGSLVLNALEDFWDRKVGSWSKVKTACMVLLEELLRTKMEFEPEVRARAKKMAADWKAKMGPVPVHSVGDGDMGRKEGDGGLGRLCYLHLLATYKLFDDGGCDKDEMIDYFVATARYPQALDLCRIMGLETITSGVIRRLINKGKPLLAANFIFEFEHADEFPPVPLLKSHVAETKRLAQNVRRSGKNSRHSLNDAAMKEITALKSVIKCIENHGLESEYRKDEMEARVEKLEKEKANGARPASHSPSPVAKRIKVPKQTKNKLVKPAAPSLWKHNLARANPQPLSVKGAAPFPAGPYSGVGPNLYVGSSANPYGLSSAPSPFPGAIPVDMHSQHHGYYDHRTGGYDGYHPMYYHHPM